MDIGKKIKLLREKNGFSQYKLAILLSLSPSTIGMYEIGEREPNLDTIQKIADIFNVTADYLINDNYDEKFKNVKFAFANVGTEGLQDEDIEDINRYIEMRKQLAKERKDKK